LTGPNRFASQIADMKRKRERSAGPAPALAQMLSTAVARHSAGAFGDAERHYREILARFPNHAETHGRLGAALMAQGKVREAISSFERALLLEPSLFEACANLAQAYSLEGEAERAANAALRAVELRDNPQSRTLFVQCVRGAPVTADPGGLRKMMLRALSEGWAPPRELTRVCIALVKSNGAIRDALAHTGATWPARPAPDDFWRSPELRTLAEDDLLCRLLQSDPIPDIGLEGALANARAAMLTAATANAHEIDDGLLRFFSAVAQQCFVNEYVYAVPDAEAAQADKLKTALRAAIGAGAEIPVLWPIAVAAYVPLNAVPGAELLCDRRWPACVDTLLAQQIREPAEERRIAAGIPALTAIDDPVSLAVREQYEESPYPRWVKADAATPPADARSPGQPMPDVLIAGCGTGLSTVEFARRMPNARVLAIDLSLASLGYAKRMAQHFGVANVTFGQADILNLGALGRNFDFIDASGVLHHLADPWRGWRVLVALLRPGAMMQVGLYSATARQNVVAARAFVAARGYRPVAEDIRRCREDIAASSEPLLHSVMQWDDFYTTSECRDLLFHANEHRVSIGEIKTFIAANRLQFAGFSIDGPTARRFAARFPARTAGIDLDCWLAFEADAPDTFAGMYRFMVRRI